MKKLFTPVLFAAAMFATTQLHAQSTVKKTARKVGDKTADVAKDVGHATGKAATKVGNKTSEIASKGASAVIDKRFEGKYGPNGENVYINNESKYYYVDKKGHHVFLTKTEMRDNPPM